MSGKQYNTPHSRSEQKTRELSGHVSVLPSSQETPSLLTGHTVGHWKLNGVLAEGGMSTIYHAQHVWLPKNGAVKLLGFHTSPNDKRTQRFQQEALAASQLDHDNIVHVTDFGHDPHCGYFMVMEYLEGQDLDQQLQHAPFGKTWILSLTQQITEALQATHHANIIHRDLKPSNIFLLPHEPHPKVKLLDFGIAKILDSNKKLTNQGIVMGTPAYLAPEQVLRQSKRPLSPAVDIYALGVILYQLFCGQLPLTYNNPLDHMTALPTQPPTPIGQFRPVLHSTPLERFLLKLLEKTPEARPATMSQVWEEFRDTAAGFADPLDVGSPPLFATVQTTSRPQKHSTAELGMPKDSTSGIRTSAFPRAETPYTENLRGLQEPNNIPRHKPQPSASNAHFFSRTETAMYSAEHAHTKVSLSDFRQKFAQIDDYAQLQQTITSAHDLPSARPTPGTEDVDVSAAVIQPKSQRASRLPTDAKTRLHASLLLALGFCCGLLCTLGFLQQQPETNTPTNTAQYTPRRPFLVRMLRAFQAQARTLPVASPTESNDNGTALHIQIKRAPHRRDLRLRYLHKVEALLRTQPRLAWRWLHRYPALPNTPTRTK